QHFSPPAPGATAPPRAGVPPLTPSGHDPAPATGLITLASAKGVPPNRVLWGHGLRNSLFSLLTSVGLQIGALVGGAVVVEQYFNMKGMGALLVTAILSSDLFTVQSVTAIIVIFVVTPNLIVDLMYAVIDPRIRPAPALG